MRTDVPYRPLSARRFSLRAAASAACLAVSGIVSASPAVTVPSPGSDIALIDTLVLRSSQSFDVQTPDGSQYRFQGTPFDTAFGGRALNARSSDGRARLYAYSVGERLVGAELYGDNVAYRMVTIGDQPYWEPLPGAAPTAARFGEPSASTSVPRAASHIAATATPDAEGTYEVTVLALYSPAVESDFGDSAAVVAEIDRTIALANAVYAFNAVPVRLQLTSIERFDGAAQTDDFYASRDQLSTDAYVTARRNATRSDLVVLYRAPGSLCGLSSGFNGMQPTGEPDHIDPELDAFDVVALDSQQSCGSLVSAHEIGHSLSAGHEYESSAAGATLDSGTPVLHAYWKPYAHAMACLGANTIGYFSMMWGPGVGGGDEPGGRTDVITNPDALLTNGQPCGSEGVDGVPASQANNVKAMTDAAPYVAAYRGPAKATVDGQESAGSSGGGAMPWAGLLMLTMIRLLSRRLRLE